MKISNALVALLFLSLAFSSCQKEQLINETLVDTDIAWRGKKDKKDKVPVCHLDDDGTYKTLYVNEKALPGHLKHGDFLFVDNDGDGYYQDIPCVEVADCNDTDPVLNEGNDCQNEECNFCFFINDIDWLFYFNFNFPDGTIVTALFTGNPSEGGLGIQVEYNYNIPNQWASLYWNEDYPTGTGELISAEQAVICRNAICKIAADQGLTQVGGLTEGNDPNKIMESHMTKLSKEQISQIQFRR